MRTATLSDLDAFFRAILRALRTWPSPLVNGLDYTDFVLRGVGFNLEPVPHPYRNSEAFFAEWRKAIEADHGQTFVGVPVESQPSKPGPNECRWRADVEARYPPQPPETSDFHTLQSWKDLEVYCQANGLLCCFLPNGDFFGRAEVRVSFPHNRHGKNPFVGLPDRLLPRIGVPEEALAPVTIPASVGEPAALRKVA